MAFLERNLFDPKARGNVWSVMKLSAPLILASAGHTLNMVVDRLMLQHYSLDAMSASFPAGLTLFALTSFFFGIVGYVGTFVAQYYGAEMHDRIGPAIWQSFYMSLIGGLFGILCVFFSRPMFEFFDHGERLLELEIQYFNILGVGTMLPMMVCGLATFWGGRGHTGVVMCMDFLITLMNIPFNAMLIFGWDVPLLHIHIPDMGVAGAAYGTLAANIIGLIVFLSMFLSRRNREKYHTGNLRFNGELFKRLFRFGGPGGVQFFMDMVTFNAFAVLLGRLGPDVMNASSVAFTFNSLAMIPMFGFGHAASILVGQSIGAGEPKHAERCVISAAIPLYSIVIVIGILFLCFPQPLLKLFCLEPGSNVYDLARKLLYFVCAYIMFDSTNILFGGAIRGAGDTKFSMWLVCLTGWFLFAIPCVIAFCIFKSGWVMARLGEIGADSWNLWVQWTILTIYVMTTAVIFVIRYRGGKWKSMSVIEKNVTDF